VQQNISECYIIIVRVGSYKLTATESAKLLLHGIVSFLRSALRREALEIYSISLQNRGTAVAGSVNQIGRRKQLTVLMDPIIPFVVSADETGAISG
jgi:hypothetical protein